MRSGDMARICRGRLSIGNLQGHTPLRICRRVQRPLTLLLRFKAMLTLKAFLDSYHFVFVFLSCLFIQGIWRSFTKNCQPRLFQRQIGHDQTVPRFCRFVSVHKQTQEFDLNIKCHELYKLHSCQPAVLLYDTWQPLNAGRRTGRAWLLIVSCFLYPNPSHIVVVCHVWYLYVFQFLFEHLYVANPIITCICPLITCICPLIQDVANISMSSYSIVNLTFLEKIVQCFTEPCYKMWHTAHSQTPIIMHFHTVYLELAVSHRMRRRQREGHVQVCGIFGQCLRPCKLNLHTRISIIGSKWNWEETLSCSQRNPTNFLQWWIRWC